MVPFIILVVNSCSERYKYNNFYTFEYGAEYGAEQYFIKKTRYSGTFYEETVRLQAVETILLNSWLCNMYSIQPFYFYTLSIQKEKCAVEHLFFNKVAGLKHFLWKTCKHLVLGCLHAIYLETHLMESYFTFSKIADIQKDFPITQVYKIECHRCFSGIFEKFFRIAITQNIPWCLLLLEF